VLLDHNVPYTLKESLTHHAVAAAVDMGWEVLKNGELLRAAESHGFEVFLTCDQNIAHQQNLSGRRIAIVAVSTNLWPVMRGSLAPIIRAVDAAHAGTYRLVVYPKPPLRRRAPP